MGSRPCLRRKRSLARKSDGRLQLLDSQAVVGRRRRARGHPGGDRHPLEEGNRYAVAKLDNADRRRRVEDGRAEAARRIESCRAEETAVGFAPEDTVLDDSFGERRRFACQHRVLADMLARSNCRLYWKL